jgi:hypothetical protein
MGSRLRLPAGERPQRSGQVPALLSRSTQVLSIAARVIAAPNLPALTEIEQRSSRIHAMFVRSLYSKESLRIKAEAVKQPQFNR